MKISRFPLSIVLWTMGFSSFAQSNCYPVEFHHGQLVLKINGPDRPLTLKFDPAAPFELYDNSGSGKYSRPFGVFAQAAVTPRPLNICRSIDGVIGFKALKGVWLLDFDRMHFKKLGDDEAESLHMQGFRPVKAQLNNAGFSVTVDINWKPYWFKANFNDRLALSARAVNKFRFINDRYVSIHSKAGLLKLFLNKPVYFLGSNYSVNIGIIDSENTAGLDFLRGFNWVLDFNSRRILVAKNGNSITGVVVPKFEVAALNESLVVTRYQPDSGVKSGDAIQAVRDVAVSATNICHLAQMIVEGEHQVTLQRSAK